MAKKVRKKTVVITDQQLKDAAYKRMAGVYEKHLSDEMGQLHNRMVAFIAESRLPLPHLISVLDILKAEAVELARKRYLGGK